MNFIEKYSIYDIILIVSFLVTIFGTLFIDVYYFWCSAIILPVLIVIYNKANYSFSDRLGAGLVGFILLLITQVSLLAVLTAFIDSKEIIISERTYEIKMLENETIVYSKDDKLELLTNKELYYKCKLQKCKELVQLTIKQEPLNDIFAKNLLLKTYYKYDIK